MTLKRREGSKNPWEKKGWAKLKYEYRQVEHSRTCSHPRRYNLRDTININNCDELSLC